MSEDKKKGSKGIVRSIFIGLASGLMLCLAGWLILTLIYGNQFKSSVPGSATGVTAKEDVIGQDVAKKDVAIQSNEELVAAMTSAEVLIPEEVEKLFAIAAPTMDISVVQGGCSDGTYFYQAFYAEDRQENQFANQCVIVKYDMGTGKVVATSEVMQLNHANDLTYNSKLGYIVVCHNSPLNNLITFVDAKTLEFVDTIPTKYFIFSIGYNAARDQYIVGLTGTKTYRVLDADFNAVTEKPFQPGKAYKSATNQGAACDDDYIYFVFWKPNVITVYDWDGNYVTAIELETFIPQAEYEPESLESINGAFYVNCGQGEATIFKVSKFVPKPEEEKK